MCQTTSSLMTAWQHIITYHMKLGSYVFFITYQRLGDMQGGYSPDASLLALQTSRQPASSQGAASAGLHLSDLQVTCKWLDQPSASACPVDTHGITVNHCISLCECVLHAQLLGHSNFDATCHARKFRKSKRSARRAKPDNKVL